MPQFPSLILAILACLLCMAWNAQADSHRSPRYGQTPSDSRPVYIVGIHPLHNPAKIFEVYSPLVNYLNKRIPNARFKLEAADSFDDFEQKLATGHYHIAHPNPQETVTAIKQGYRVIGMVKRDTPSRGIMLVRRDSGIASISALKGKVIAFPAQTAFAAAMLQQYHLQTRGIDVKRDITAKYVGSQESAIMNVFAGAAAAGCTWTIPWQEFSKKNPEKAAQLTVLWESEPITINSGLVVHKRVPPSIAEKTAEVILAMPDDPEGAAVLKATPLLPAFTRAENRTYLPLQKFLQQFSKTVGPLKGY